MNECLRHFCLQAENLSVRLNGQLILDGINLHLHYGELTAVIGPNGAGKSTLLKALLGEVPHSGRVDFQIGGASKRRIRIGYVPQKLEFEADSPLSVADFLAMGYFKSPALLGVPRHRRNIIAGRLSPFGAEELLDRRLGELSGGERQRVLLALALYPKPDLLLLDEPDAGVDSNGMALFYNIVDGLKSHRDLAVILVTHDIVGIARIADRMILVNRKVLADASPQEVLSNEVLLRDVMPEILHVSKLPEFSLKDWGH